MNSTANSGLQTVVRGEGYLLAHLFFVVPVIVLQVQYIMSVIRRRRLKKQFRAVIRNNDRSPANPDGISDKSD
ncbi:uncharacterized protein CELE_Y45F10D.16 [Caenorhabditis elegans]|uniref:Transmembrane protein n=1 Tax=Caenorhabditis elegans TaxID=6239 RepID=Q56VZ8_CAEEL|nr:Transmembrane protein [Caenorhabditis elegans]CAI79274.1 Transmembrane protein [Caenorhabditis elegans]|eukprot:NP_001023473.1 Uncharacterized protein CELE_Y45F10D.16 [Caenorhabditis elegans]